MVDSEKTYTNPELFKNKKNKLGLLFSFIQTLPADHIFELLKDIEAYLKKCDLNKISSIDKWLSFYTDPDIMWDYSLKYVTEQWKTNPYFKFLAHATLCIFQPATPTIRDNIKEFFPELNTKGVLSFISWWEKIDSNTFLTIDTIEETMQHGKKFKDDDFLHFLFRVIYPCWYFFGDSHHELFRKAQKGDIESICNLLRLDKTIINDTTISKIFHQASMDIESNTFKKMHQAMVKFPKMTSIKRHKATIAAHISKTSKSVGTNLTAPQIQDLFDSVAQIKCPGTIIDPDIESPEAFAKSLQRISRKYKN